MKMAIINRLIVGWRWLWRWLTIIGLFRTICYANGNRSNQKSKTDYMFIQCVFLSFYYVIFLVSIDYFNNLFFVWHCFFPQFACQSVHQPFPGTHASLCRDLLFNSSFCNYLKFYPILLMTPFCDHCNWEILTGF